MKNKEIRIKSKDINFSNVYKITKIGIDEIEFKKYDIKRLNPLMESVETRDNEYENIVLDGESIGVETYKIKPHVLLEIAGKTGTIIKSFSVKLEGKRKKQVIVDKIEFLGEGYNELE